MLVRSQTRLEYILKACILKACPRALKENHERTAMVNSPPTITTVPTETWVEIAWEDFLGFVDDPTLVNGRFYYDQGMMRIEMSPVGFAHSRDSSIVSTLIILYATIKVIPIHGLTNASFRKSPFRESQPDIAFYIGQNQQFPPYTNSPVNLNDIEAPTLVVEVSASTLEDDRDRKLQLYQRMGVTEYWVVDVNRVVVQAFALASTSRAEIRESRVLPGLALDIVETALQRSRDEDDGAISRWLLQEFSA
jgi:Uma2 family endonuclease